MPQDRLAIFGTQIQEPKPRVVTLGSVQASLLGGDVVGLTHAGEEVLRRIAYPVRDADWGTLATVTLTEDISESPDLVTYTRHFLAGDGAISGHFSLDLTSGKRPGLAARLRLTATRDIRVNRAGFVLLHPVAGLAGQPLRVLHDDGRSQETVFPDLISPGQPVFSIRGLSWRAGAVRADLDLSGEIFEMEDQRNWSDASYKTYCRPLSWPRPYVMAAGQAVDQTIRLQLSPTQPRGVMARAAGSDVVIPAVELAAEPDLPPTVSGLDGLTTVLRCRSDATVSDLKAYAGRPVALDVILPEHAPPHFEALAQACRTAGLHPQRVMALPAAYLASHQPEGPWPGPPAPRDLIAPLRAAFPAVAIGTGVLTNFTELNRCPPDAHAADFITFATTAIVHAADDLSVLQTLQALPDIRRSAWALASGRPLRLGLVTIPMRTNPYGSDVALNPDGGRVPMAMQDPRHGALFGAAWAVGAVSALAGEGVASLCLAMTGGPLGLDTGAGVSPLFHLLRALQPLAGQPARPLVGGGLTGLVTTSGAVVVANLTGQDLPAPPGTSHVLHATTCAAAAADRDWLARPGQGAAMLPPFAIAFLRGTP